MVDTAVAYSPCHISGLAVLFRDSSVGAGINIEEGMTTRIETRKSPKMKVNFFLNNQPFDNPMTSSEVVVAFRDLYGSDFELSVFHSCKLPVGHGLGTSGAGALSLSFALNHALNLNLPPKDVVEIAHNSEVNARTGLSTVTAESLGGFVIRPKHKFRDIEVNNVDEDIYVLPVAPLSTKQIISTDFWKSKINMYSRKAMKDFLEKKSIDALIEASRHVAFSTGLAELNSFVFKYLTMNKTAGMTMFGFTVFSNKALGHPKVIKTRVARKGACLL